MLVPHPRATDPISATLRDAFPRDPRLPDEMMVLIAQLNGVGTRHDAFSPRRTCCS